MDEAKQPGQESQLLPPHEVLGEIGHNAAGCSACYRARDLSRDVLVTLQVIGPAFFETPDAAARFLREARAFAGLRLPYVLPVHEAGLYQGRIAFTTKLTPNGCLRDHRARFTDPREAADLVEKLARGTAAAHAHGLLHGRLCPEAVHFDELDQPLIGFLDLVGGALPDSTAEAASGIRGAPAYMPPERVAEPPGRIEATADVWALGIILYELLTSRRPFAGANAVETLQQVLSLEPVPPRRLRPDIDLGLETVVLRCLEKKPDDRYGSARALAEDLERWGRAEPTIARPPTLTQRILRGLSRALGGGGVS